MIEDAAKQNWLLWGLLFISVAIHLILFFQIAGWYRPTIPVYIELALQDISRTVQRQIPRPQHMQKPRTMPRGLDDLKVPEDISIQEKVTPLPALKNLLPMQTPEQIQPPKLPEVEGVDIAVWKGEKATAPPSAADMPGIKSDPLEEKRYFAEVGRVIGKKVEALYRKRAKKRQVEGRTVVKMMIDKDGGLKSAEVVETSDQHILDQIALKAVKASSPFPPPPNGDITLLIPINFKLI